jgi:spore germination cell wall hydrolase CwlJ-like protein
MKKRNLQRIFAAFMATAMAVTAAGCSKEEKPAETPTEAPTQQAQTGDTETKTTDAPTEAPTEAATEAVAAASSDTYLLAAIVYAEAGGESYDGQLAVASVIMNRLANGSWGSTLSDVIYAPSQFTGTGTAAFSTALSTGGSETSLSAAQAALGGANNIGGAMYFRPTWNCDTSSLSSYTQIGNHIFY